MINFLKKLFGGGPDLKEIISRNAMIIDVRTPEEFRRGHVKGSVNIPLNSLHGNIKKLQKKKVPIITCCASGRRSGIAAKQLEQVGIEAYNGGPWTRVRGYF
ncbi:MAG: rhodanese-like domain-containing protein [Saprospiraceae bacterium]|nr:rhodanese-like domain-containing protein [Lewinella sp.]